MVPFVFKVLFVFAIAVISSSNVNALNEQLFEDPVDDDPDDESFHKEFVLEVLDCLPCLPNPLPHFNQLIKSSTLFCDAFRPIFQCFEKCHLPSKSSSRFGIDWDKIRNAFKKRFELACIKYWTEVKNELSPCLSKNGQAIMSQCDNQCQQYKTQGDWLEKYGTLPRNENFKFMDQVFRDYCGYYGCDFQCRVPALTSLCGAKVAEMERELNYNFLDLIEVVYSEGRKVVPGSSDFKLNCRERAEFYDQAYLERDEL